MLELKEKLVLETPRGKAIAHFVIDPGPQSNLQWVCFMRDDGSCWTFDNKEIRIEKNATLGIRTKETNGTTRSS